MASRIPSILASGNKTDENFLRKQKGQRMKKQRNDVGKTGESNNGRRRGEEFLTDRFRLRD